MQQSLCIKIVLPILLVNVLPLAGLSQLSYQNIGLEKGAFDVGYQHLTLHDSSRTYKRNGDWTKEHTARPIPLSIWYPGEESGNGETSLHVLDYMEILKQEEEWEYLPNEQILNWFYYANTPQNQKHLEEACWAENAGALTLALPLSGDVPTAENIRDGLYYKLLHDDRLNARIPLLTTINDPMSLTEARREAQANVELWEAIDLDDPSPSRDAAVALNSFLWKHTGGWRNTFG